MVIHRLLKVVRVDQELKLQVHLQSMVRIAHNHNLDFVKGLIIVINTISGVIAS